MFGAINLTNHVDTDQYKYSGYDIGFDRKGEFSFVNGFGRNVTTLGADMSSSVYANNRTENIRQYNNLCRTTAFNQFC